MKIIGSTNITGVNGWGKLSDITNPNTDERTIIYRGAASTRTQAFDALKELYDNASITGSGTTTIYEWRVYISDITITDVWSDDVKVPTLSITPTESEIPLCEIGDASTLDYIVQANKHYPKLLSLWKSGDIKGINDYVASNTDAKKIAYWICQGITTKTQTCYCASVTRYMRLNSKSNMVYGNVDTVVAWSYVSNLCKFSAPEPKPNDKALQWLVRAPSVNVIDKKWIEVSQNFLGAYRYPEFYTNGSWLADESIFPLKVS